MALLIGTLCQAQQINVVDLNQMFRPSLSAGFEFSPSTNYKTYPFDVPTTQEFNSTRSYISGIIPVKGSLGLDIDFNLKNVLKPRGALKLKAYQLFWTFYAERTHLNLPSNELYNDFLSVGTGMSLVRYVGKKRAEFYSANFLVSENDNEFSSTTLRFTGFYGRAILKNLKRQFFYGVVFSYTNGFNIPIPFGGVAMKVGKKGTFAAILPVQISYSHKYSKAWQQAFFVGLNAYRTGYGNYSIFQHPLTLPPVADEQSSVDLSLWQIRIGTRIKHKLSKKVRLMAYGGYATGTNFRFERGDELQKASADGAPFGGVSLYYTFHKSLVRSILERVSIEW